jgi:hypothetical protein
MSRALKIAIYTAVAILLVCLAIHNYGHDNGWTFIYGSASLGPFFEVAFLLREKHSTE